MNGLGNIRILVNGGFFEGAAGASGFRLAEFFADTYRQYMVFIVKLRILL
jgi:hypothetical protein